MDEKTADNKPINALLRAARTMQKYEAERKLHGTYPTETMMELLARASAYAQIAQAQEQRSASNRAGDFTQAGLDEDYEA